MNSILISLKKRWQLVLFMVLNVPMMVSLGMVLYLSYLQMYAQEMLETLGTTVFAYAILLAVLAPYVIGTTLLSLPFLFLYLWKLGGIVPQ